MPENVLSRFEVFRDFWFSTMSLKRWVGLYAYRFQKDSEVNLTGKDTSDRFTGTLTLLSLGSDLFRSYRVMSEL